MIDLNDESINEEGAKPIFNGGAASTGAECELTDVSQDEQSGAWDFFFTDASGGTLKHREWKVDYERPDSDKKERSQAIRLKHILTKFLDAGTQLPQAQNSEDLLSKCAALLGNSYAGVKVRLKVIFKDNGYLTVPPYVPFLELASVPVADTKLRFGANELTEKPQATAPAQAATNGVAAAGEVEWPSVN